MAWTYEDKAGGIIATDGNRPIGGTSLTLQTGQGSKFGTNISPSTPMRLTVYTDTVYKGVLKCTARSGDTFTIDGTADGKADFAVLVGDKIGNIWGANDAKDLWTSITTNTSDITNLTTSLSGKVDTSTLSNYATTTTTNSLNTRLTNAETALAGKQASLPNGGTTSQYLRGDLTWQSLPATVITSLLTNGSGITISGSGTTGSPYSISANNSGTVTSVALTVPTGFSIGGSPITTNGTLAITTTLSGVIKGTGTGFAAAVAGTDYVIPSALSSYVLTSTYTSGLATKEPTITAGTTAQYLRGDKSLSTFATDVVAALPSQGGNSAKFLTTNGTALSWGAPAKPLVHLGRWASPTGSATLTGNIDERNIAVPVSCTPLKVYLSATVNTTGASIQVKVDGVDLFSSPITLAGGTTAPTAFTTFALSSITADAVIKPTITSIGSDVRGLVVDVWARES